MEEELTAFLDWIANDDICFDRWGQWIVDDTISREIVIKEYLEYLKQQ